MPHDNYGNYGKVAAVTIMTMTLDSVLAWLVVEWVCGDDVVQNGWIGMVVSLSEKWKVSTTTHEAI